MALENTIFYNADYIVIEYIDIIKSPYMVLLTAIREELKSHSDKFELGRYLKSEEIIDLDNSALYEWYINRKNMNFFKDLNKFPDTTTEEDMWELLNSQICLSPIFYKAAPYLILTDSIPIMHTQKLAKDIIIYHPHTNNYAQEDLEDYLGFKCTFMSDFEEVLDVAKENSTYFLSDINKINIMNEKGYLKYSSITLPIEYRYNRKNMTDFSIDFNELLAKVPFKLSYMRACSYDAPNDDIKMEES